MIKMIKRRSRGLIVMVVFLAGCNGNIKRLETFYGKSYKQAKYSQIVNPEAGKNLNPVYGLDGHAAQNEIGAYRQAFEVTPLASKENVFSGLGGDTANVNVGK